MFEVFWNFVKYVELFFIGLNCVLGVRDMRGYIVELLRVVECYVSVYFNVGLFNEFGEYDEMLEMMGDVFEEFVCVGIVNIVGGCCGIMFDYIYEFVGWVWEVFLCCFLEIFK